MRRLESWTLADVLDFEFLLAADGSGDDSAIRERDRAIFEKSIAPELGAAVREDRRALFRCWLEARRRRLGDTLPGRHFTAAWQTLQMLAALVGLGLGISITAGLLHYRGEEPVNVAWFFAATVGVQWLLLAGACALWLLRRTTRALEDLRPLRALMDALLWAVSAGLRRLPGEQRDRFRAALATIHHRREIHGSLATWPLLIGTQLFGVCFNVGVLATLLLHVSLSDVAFGWQSTLRTSPEEALRLVAAVATPWSAAPNAHPTFDQVVASRFAYSAGIAPLSQAAMASWWPFLCYAVAVYGLLVRALLLAWATAGLRGALRRIAFDHHGCNALFRRLTGPIFNTQENTTGLEVPPLSESATAHVAGRAVVLLAEDLRIDAGELAQSLHTHFGWEVMASLPVQIDHPSANAAELARLASSLPEIASVVVAVPAHRAPIKAIALFLQQVLAAAGGKETVVLLFGRPLEIGFAPVSAEEFGNWQRFNAINALHLGLEKWRPA